MIKDFVGKREEVGIIDDYCPEEEKENIETVFHHCTYIIQYIIEELDKLVGYYEQPQDQFEMGFRQGIYRAKMKVEEILKNYEKEG